MKKLKRNYFPSVEVLFHFFDIDDDKRTYRVASSFLMVYVVKSWRSRRLRWAIENFFETLLWPLSYILSFRLLYWITRCYCSKAIKSVYLDEIGVFFGNRVLPIGTQSVFQSNWDISFFQVFFLRKPSLKLLSFPKSPKFLERFWKNIIQRPSSFFYFRRFYPGH